MPIVTVQQSAGRSLDQRRQLMAAITSAFVEAYGISPEAVTVFLSDTADDEWGKGGRLHRDRDQ